MPDIKKKCPECGGVMLWCVMEKGYWCQDDKCMEMVYPEDKGYDALETIPQGEDDE